MRSNTCAASSHVRFGFSVISLGKSLKRHTLDVIVQHHFENIDLAIFYGLKKSTRIKHKDVIHHKQPVKSFRCSGQISDAVQSRKKRVVPLPIRFHLRFKRVKRLHRSLERETFIKTICLKVFVNISITIMCIGQRADRVLFFLEKRTINKLTSVNLRYAFFFQVVVRIVFVCQLKARI